MKSFFNETGLLYVHLCHLKKSPNHFDSNKSVERFIDHNVNVSVVTHEILINISLFYSYIQLLIIQYEAPLYSTSLAYTVPFNRNDKNRYSLDNQNEFCPFV